MIQPRLLSTLTLAACAALASCSKESQDALASTAKSAQQAAGNLDLTKLAPEAMAEKAKGIIGDLSTQAMSIKDAAGAKDLVAKFQPMVDQLVGAKSMLQGQKFDMSGISKLVTDVTAKFSGNTDIMGALQPLLDKLKGLAG
jgi:hypothetical protein